MSQTKVRLSSYLDKTLQDAESVFAMRNRDSLRNLSIALLTMAYCFREKEHQQVQSEMLVLLGVNPRTMAHEGRFTAEQAWMLGRVLIVANETDREGIAALFEAYLAQDDNPGYQASDHADACAHAWAVSYYLIYAGEHRKGIYSNRITAHVSDSDVLIHKLAEDKTTNMTNIIWLYVMNLHAAASKNDTIVYGYLKNKFKDVVAPDSNQNHLGKMIIQHLPENDLRFWAYSLTMHSVILMHDKAELWNSFPESEASQMTTAHFSSLEERESIQGLSELTLGHSIQMRACDNLLKAHVDGKNSPVVQAITATGCTMC